MTKVVVVNSQEIDGKYRKRGETITVSPGRARDLVAVGKVTQVAEPKADQSSAKQGTAKSPVKQEAK